MTPFLIDKKNKSAKITSMYLKRVELIGFKSFAQRTVLEFAPPEGDKFSITSIVGPNGSGKSNIGDGIRWALGEQSIKSLRGKTSEDVIFSGSDKKLRLNVAEVSLFFNNEDGLTPIDYKEFTITRRIYRNGEGEYLINKSKVRLQDILMLLARANFGQKSYSIISQGMVDQVLQASPMERKKFFDEATGIRQYQIKRDEAARKIEKSEENLKQAEIALAEIEPRMKSLTRQIKRLEKRQEIEGQLQNLQKKYYGSILQGLDEQIIEINKEIQRESENQKIIEKKLSELQKESENLVYEETDDKYQNLQKDYQKILELKDELFNKQSTLKAKIYFEEEKRKQVQLTHQKTKFAGDPEKIFSELKDIGALYEKFLQNLNQISLTEDLEKIKNLAQDVSKKINHLFEYFQRPQLITNLPNENEVEKIQKEKDELDQQISDLNKKLSEINQELGLFTENERQKRTKLLEWQRKIQDQQSELNVINHKINEFQINLARVETKKDTLLEEIKNEMKIDPQNLSIADETVNQEIAMPFEEIQNLKHQLELIGGIDPEVTKEYPQVHEHFEFLNTQSIDLREGIKSLNLIIKELDKKIKEQFTINFSKINQEFERYFKMFFGGGKAKIVFEEDQELQEKDEEQKINPEDENNKEISPRLTRLGREIEEGEEKESGINGIEILAVPPGKKVKNVETLSGGERALTSLALIFAIININKPPFVVIDESDAALDEQNSNRFAQILDELRNFTQFIVITHNRQTMEAANILYGVTISVDGVSKLISLKLED